MAKWLVLCSEEEDSWVRRVLKGRPVVGWINKVSQVGDLHSEKIVIAAFSDPDLQVQALRTIADHRGWDGPVAALLAGGSATLMAAKSGLGGRLVGFSPYPNAEDPPALELYQGETSGIEAINTLREAFEGFGIRVFICRDQAGGILPRVLASMVNEAARVAYEGIAPVEKIDKMMRLGANFPMGPFEWADKMGLDTVLNLLERMHAELGEKYRPHPWIRRKVESGKLGIKSGEGFYKYNSGGRP